MEETKNPWQSGKDASDWLKERYYKICRSRYRTLRGECFGFAGISILTGTSGAILSSEYRLLFVALTENARKLTGCNFILASILISDTNDMSVLGKFESILTSLALNGYANLVIGEPTCELNENWGVQLAV